MKKQKSDMSSDTMSSIVKNSLICLCAVLTATLVHSPTNAYELATHARVTYMAYAQSTLAKEPRLLKSLGIDTLILLNPSDPFGKTYYDVSVTDTRERSANSFETEFMTEREDNPSPVIPPDVTNLSLPSWLMRGAIREDDYARAFGTWVAPNPQADPDQPQAFWRIMNHFYDPVGDRPLTLNAAQASAFALFTQESTDFRAAPAWALGTSNTDAFLHPNMPETGRRNHFTVFDAREAMFRALTLKAKNPDGTYTDLGPSGSLKTKNDVRDAYRATTFRALGDVVHLVEDMGQPQHTRNDQYTHVVQNSLRSFS